MKFSKLLMFLVISFLVIPTNILAAEYNKGDINNPAVVVSKDGVTITKKISKGSDDLRYKVEFTIEGKNIVESVSKDIYVSLVFDRSGSMICENGTKTIWTPFTTNSVTINNKKLYCYNNDLVNTAKWESAVQGAIDFSQYVVSNIDTSNINLFTFASDVSNAKSWSRASFVSSDFGFPNGSTNLHLALEEAKKSLDSVSNDALKYIVVISDGEPSYYEEAINIAEEIKKSGISIYTVGYETNDSTKELLKEISSGEGYYFDSNSLGLGTILENLAKTISSKAIGSDAVLIDTLGEQFSFAEDYENVSGNKITYKFDKIDENKLSVSFEIVANDDVDAGWYDTNDYSNKGVILKYKDYNNEEKEIVLDNSSSVYLEREKRDYIVNYYKDSVSDENLLGEISGTDYVGKEIILDKDKYLPDGYNSDSVEIDKFTIYENGNLINVVYKKNSYQYHIEYYKDDITVKNLIAKSKNAEREYLTEVTFDTLVSDFGEDFLDKYIPDGYLSGNYFNGNILIDTDDNVVKILYLKDNSLFYKIEYYFNGKLDSSKTDIVTGMGLGDKIDDLTFKEFDNYILKQKVNFPLEISNDPDSNVIKLYYESVREVVDDNPLPPKTLVNKENNFGFICLGIISSCIFIFAISKYNSVKLGKK